MGIATAYYAGGLLPLTYEFDNYKFDLMRMYTNLPACGAQRGHGAPQPKYAFESHLDNIARDLGIDPLEYPQTQCTTTKYQILVMVWEFSPVTLQRL